MNLFNRKDKNDTSGDKLTFARYPHLLAIKPLERYVFHSDYFEIDDSVATIMSFFHTEGASDNFGAFWGIARTPLGLHDDIVTIGLEQNKRVTDSWINQNQAKAESMADKSLGEMVKNGTHTSSRKANRKTHDIADIAIELNDGASYIHSQYKLYVKAPNIEMLDEAITKINRYYIERFQTLTAASFSGEQRNELSNFFDKNERKPGKGFYFTSTELAGSHALVTRGLEDKKGEYVGSMVGDINDSAVLFDVNKYKNHTVIGMNGTSRNYGITAQSSDLWCSKLSQSCLLDGHKVVHIVLNRCKLDELGPDLSGITNTVDLSKGDVNMFEMFGNEDNELSIFATQMEKLTLMSEQLYTSSDDNASVVKGYLQEVATKFYIDNHMWAHNAKDKRDDLRVVNIPHGDVPRLKMFVSYLNTEYKATVTSDENDQHRTHAIAVLRSTFTNLLSNNGDLFNTVTSDSLDGALTSRRAIYEFADLFERGQGVAMAQLINIIGFATRSLGRGDLLIIHGADIIDSKLKGYIGKELDRLFRIGARVCYSYDNTENMVDDRDFCKFDGADYTILGNMSKSVLEKYKDIMQQEIPGELHSVLTENTYGDVTYIRRGVDNVLFRQDLPLGLENRRNR